MKYLIMCEGANELEIMRILLKYDLLIFTPDELLNLVPYHARQIDKSTAVKAALNIYSGQIKVLRIGDSLNDKLRIPAAYNEKIIGISKYCTKPELEMLFILAENLIDEYNKVKSIMRPKIFVKKNIRCGKRKYDNSTEFYREYFGSNPELLVHCINLYKQKHGTNKKDEGYLADLLK